ncbi:GPP34 family phosphoprotein [Winogradskyella sp. DF17]|uniref:GPP34 family phosphoprotein n=1 Tax=Winogradskyella pelagia TaxID=2819984 RepID=A0ABS3T2K4_9FLAO|nr:GPP34 family phosphoprotein [Winogradskyella sp. DF17]MBO3116970.1 GPP34 family phosphoprotein [Winogradskyella sp. DF17]
MIDLNLADKMLLLALDDEKGTFVSGPFALTYGLAGAILLELSLKESIKIVNKKVVVNSSERLDDVLLERYLELLRTSKKERSLKYWIEKLGNKERAIKKEILDKLILKGILVKREQKFLWVFNNDKFPTVNAKPEHVLRKRLYELIESNTKPTLEELMLISLIDTCDLNKTVYGKDRAKRCKDNIKRVIADAKNSLVISTTIKEVHDVILTMLVVVMTSSIAATTAASS